MPPSSDLGFVFLPVGVCVRVCVCVCVCVCVTVCLTSPHVIRESVS